MKEPFSYKKLLLLGGLALIVVAGSLAVMMALRGRETPAPAAAPKKEALTVFLPTDEGTLFRKRVETKDGISQQEKMDIIMRELRMGNAIPDTVTLHEFSIDGEGVLYLNFSQDMKREKIDAAEEITTVYSVINSFLINFREAGKAQILVEGQAPHTLAGVVYTFAPLEINNQLVEE
ncbi:MAG TPA: GerMN domain-containing protein [Syntrophorhabdaceae bacterium]|jgi:hypothetical protein